jgi:hypothetical protein
MTSRVGWLSLPCKDLVPRFASGADRFGGRKWHQGFSRRLENMRGEDVHRLATVAQFAQASISVLRGGT